MTELRRTLLTRSIITVRKLRMLPCLPLLVVGLAGATLATASPALATQEAKKCAEPCAGYILAYNYVKNILGLNIGKTGVCADFEYTSGERPFDKCNETGEGIEACLTAEIYARGEVERWYDKYLYDLFIEQNNFKECKFDY